MRFCAAMACALFACTPAHGVDLIVDSPFYTLGFHAGRAMSTGSVGGDHTSNTTVRLSIDGGPVIDFVNADTILSGIAWKPFRYSFLATSGKTRIGLTSS